MAGDEPGLLTGDTILGRGTTVVAHPDGRLADYLGSLAGSRDLPGPLTLLPGHGAGARRRGGAGRGLPGAPGAAAGAGAAAALAGRRHSRATVVRRVYADVDESLWPAAELSVLAQLDYLAATERSP